MVQRPKKRPPSAPSAPAAPRQFADAEDTAFRERVKRQLTPYAHRIRDAVLSLPGIEHCFGFDDGEFWVARAIFCDGTEVVRANANVDVAFRGLVDGLRAKGKRLDV